MRLVNGQKKGSLNYFNNQEDQVAAPLEMDALIKVVIYMPKEEQHPKEDKLNTSVMYFE